MQTEINQQHRQQGVTLVEMMIAMVISLLLMAGVYQTYLGSKQAYRTQDGLSRLQENARFAMDQLTRDIRMANNFGCVPAPINQFGDQVIVDRSGSFNFDPTNPATPANNGGIASIPDTNGTDSITIRGIGGPNGVVASPVASVTGTTVALVPGSTLPAVGETVVISNCRMAEIDVVTAVDTAAEEITLPNITGIAGATYGLGTMVYPVRTIVYTVQPGTSQNGLFRDADGPGPQVPQEVAEGLESIDFLFRETTGTAFTTSDGVTNWNLIDVVRVSMVFSTPRDNIATTNQTYTVVDNAGATTTATAADRRLYRMVSALIDVRK
ncbi:MAG TPA: prepilin-type N-terminal cleavage/methylation domain-containing protein [Chromatiales bacterium]|nr:prepilin-type N-terminal cleavage/methylation domain-containing protein [Thiotrichales bacterium]HIP69319.1 prepilin-type N-terminal cleavage/methylation domain-containing protein [Chromatiales bacterium]